MTVNEAAKALGVSASTVYDLCANRKLGHYRFGMRSGKIVIEEAHLEAYRRERLIEVSPHPVAKSVMSLPLKHVRLPGNR